MQRVDKGVYLVVGEYQRRKKTDDRGVVGGADQDAPLEEGELDRSGGAIENEPEEQ